MSFPLHNISSGDETPPVVIPQAIERRTVRRRGLRRSASGSFAVPIGDVPTATISLSTSTGAVNSGGTHTLTLIRSGGLGAMCSASISLGGGTSTSGDYSAPSPAIVSWGVADTANKTITFTATDDPDGDETVVATVAPRVNAIAGSTSTQTVTIRGKSSIQFSASTASVQAGNNLTLTLTRTGATSQACSVGITITAGSATSGDYGSASPNPVTWAIGDSANKTVTIPTTSDADASNESFTVSLSSPSACTVGAISSVVVTITPLVVSYRTETQDYIARLAAEGLSRTTAELNLIDALFGGLATDGTLSLITEIASWQVTGSNALAIASHKLKPYTGVPKATFFDATNASFSRTLGFTSTAGTGGGHFRTGVPQNFGVAGTSSSRGRALGTWPTSAPTDTFAAWLGAGNGSNPWTIRLGAATTTLNYEFHSGSMSATSQSPFTNRLITGVTESGSNARIYNGSTAVGTSVTVPAIAIGTAEIAGHVYMDAAGTVTGGPWAMSSALYILISGSPTASQIASIQTRLNTFVTGMAAL